MLYFLFCLTNNLKLKGDGMKHSELNELIIMKGILTGKTLQKLKMIKQFLHSPGCLSTLTSETCQHTSINTEIQ